MVRSSAHKTMFKCKWLPYSLQKKILKVIFWRFERKLCPHWVKGSEIRIYTITKKLPQWGEIEQDCDLGELVNVHDWKSALKKHRTKKERKVDRTPLPIQSQLKCLSAVCRADPAFFSAIVKSTKVASRSPPCSIRLRCLSVKPTHSLFLLQPEESAAFTRLWAKHCHLAINCISTYTATW